ncbi:MAG: hypothetical protein LBS33_06385 [Streptococcaceae bacterium]|jgi:hypothetical protein|nr:hypothetical protein [Streptococcaceae bacterium]
MKKNKFYLYYFVLYLLTVIVTVQINYLNPFQVLRSKIYDFDLYYFSKMISIVLIWAMFYLIPLFLGYCFKKRYWFWQILYPILICLYIFIENTFLADEKWRGALLTPSFWQDGWYLAILVVVIAIIVSVPISLGSAHLGTSSKNDVKV